MEPLRDLTWMKYLIRGPPAETVERKAFTAIFIAVPQTKQRHFERYRYRSFIFEPSGKAPVLAVNLETGILGECLLTIEDARERGVLERYNGEPPFDAFRTRALEEAGLRLRSAVSAASKSRAAGPRGARTEKPAAPQKKTNGKRKSDES